MKVLVTGGSGFIGGNIVKELVGHDVDILDITRPSYYTNAKFIWEDIRNEISIENIYDIIYHCAGILGVSTSFGDVAGTSNVNIVGTINILEWVRGSDTIVIQPNLIGTWSNPYMISAHAREDYGMMYHREYGVQYISLRPMNVYGPMQPWHQHKMAPMFIINALTGRPIEVNGAGDATINVTYVKDIAKLFVAAPGRCAPGQIVELPNPNGYTTPMEFARLVVELANPDCPVVNVPMRKGEPEHTNIRANPDLAIEIFGDGNPVAYASWFTPLQTGLNGTIDWYRSVL